VRVYSEYYFEKASNSEYLIDSLKSIEYAQARLRLEINKLKKNS